MERLMTLENSYCSISVDPERGAKITSIRYKQQDREILLVPDTIDEIPYPEYGQEYGPQQSWGFDEMFPTINKEVCSHPHWEGMVMPDHGEVWALPWKASFDDDTLHTSIRSPLFPYKLSRMITLEDNSIIIDYRAENLSNLELPCLWAAHMLLAVHEEMVLSVPEGMDRTINGIREQMGEVQPFPGVERRDIIPAYNGTGMQKYYFSAPIPEGGVHWKMIR